MLRFTRVSQARTTVGGGVAVCQLLFVATHCDGSLVFRLQNLCN